MKSWCLFVLLIWGGITSLIAQPYGNSPAQQMQIHERKAHELLNEKKPELAAKEFAAVLTIDPQNLDAQGNLGVLLYFRKDYAAAEPHLRDALAQKPDLTNIRALLGMCERHLGKIDSARTDLEAVLPQLKDPKIRLEAGLELIEIYSTANDMPKAAETIAILRQGDPTDPRILYAAYRIYSQLAGEAMLDLSIAAPESGQMHQAMAHELYREGDPAGTIANLQKALAEDPHLPGIHFELAEAYHISPDLSIRPRAESEYKLALAENPREEKAWTRLGDIVADKGNLDEAVVDYTHALDLQPSDADAAIGMARIDLDRNNPAAAAAALERVIASDPTNVLAHYRLIAVYRKLNRPDDARRELAAFQKYKAMKDQLGTIYKDLRFDTRTDKPEQ
jgi:Tfp pilus assembly protein PilF